MDEEISIGDYVLTGGELAAMVVIDAVIKAFARCFGIGSVCDGGFLFSTLFWSIPSIPGPSISEGAWFRRFCFPETISDLLVETERGSQANMDPDDRISWPRPISSEEDRKLLEEILRIERVSKRESRAGMMNSL